MAKREICGIYGSRTAEYLYSEVIKRGGKSLIVVSNNNRAKSLYSDLSFFVDENKLFRIKAREEGLVLYEAQNRDDIVEEMEAFFQFQSSNEGIMIVPAIKLLERKIPRDEFKNNQIYFEKGYNLDLKDLAEKLLFMGYERKKIIYGKGQYSIRGNIIDIFSYTMENPFRVELFDTEIDNIRSFDIDTQKSIEKYDKFNIIPNSFLPYNKNAQERFKSLVSSRYKLLPDRRDELIFMAENRDNIHQLEFYTSYFYKENNSLLDYFEDMQIELFIEDLQRIKDVLEFNGGEYKKDFSLLLKKGKVVGEDFNNAFSKDEVLNLLLKSANNVLTPMETGSKLYGFEKQELSIVEPISYNGRQEVFIKSLVQYLRKNYKSIKILCQDEVNKVKIREIIEFSKEKFEKNNMKLDEVLDNIILFEIGNLSKGFDDRDRKVLYLTDTEILGVPKKYKEKKLRRKFRSTKPIYAFSEIKKDDFVVHEAHGVGKFLGIVQIETQGITKDFIHIKYAGNDALYVPVEQMDRVQKYIGSDANPPKIYKLSGMEWQRTKDRAKSAILEMAKEIIEISAIRKAEKGFKFSKDTKWQKEFEDSFIYDETEDQLRCIAEIKEDMEKEEVMDRLLCGDVGYGKTEVAARAMFKCVMDSKQVAMLVPTTILANQHYNTLKDRFKDFPIKIEMLSRFKTVREQKEIIKSLKVGEIDIIVGTHSLLSNKVEYNDLGLLVIDEEQRFGVTHKEKIKTLKENIDVLTLSATPIPRTLHLSLMGIRSMSLIEEPPSNRIPVQTYVVEEDDDIIREAILREIGRDGQVYIVFNKVKGIKTLAERIKRLVPEASVAIAHGQMEEKTLEEVILDFQSGKIKIIVATSIIESGIDIPNANTEIIIDADKFGLSQLYQLRGRVGRSDKVAYAYLTHKKNKSLSEVSEKRLRAIKEFTEFGAGFKIAMRDLEIRGAGNLLGAQQHGHIVGVGYELYTKMVQEAVAVIRGEVIKDERDDVVIDIKAPSYIPNFYISDEAIKFDVYRQIASTKSKKRQESLIEELEDRFGNIPKEVTNLMKVSRIKYWAEEIGIKRIFQNEKDVQFFYGERGVKPIKISLINKEEVLDEVLDVLLSLANISSYS